MCIKQSQSHHAILDHTSPNHLAPAPRARALMTPTTAMNSQINYGMPKIKHAREVGDVKVPKQAYHKANYCLAQPSWPHLKRRLVSHSYPSPPSGRELEEPSAKAACRTRRLPLFRREPAPPIPYARLADAGTCLRRRVSPSRNQSHAHAILTLLITRASRAHHTLITSSHAHHCAHLEVTAS